MIDNKNFTSIMEFYRTMSPGLILPPGIALMNPFADNDSARYAEMFYKKFYSDPQPRILIFGINPGRFGGGITGIPFTDPIRLAQDCDIPNTLTKRAELSSEFIYKVVETWGGAASFYQSFFFTALSPLGFTRNGINLNYYDDKQLVKDIKPFIIDCIRKQLEIFRIHTICICLGEGTNYKFFSRLNDEYAFFEEIIPLPHPRWIMQYRRKKMDEYIQLYKDKLHLASNVN